MKIANQNSSHILIVDDDDSIRELVHFLVSEADYNVSSVASGYEALDFISSNPPNLILLDIKMPGMNGYDVCRELKSNPATQSIPIIFMSALDESADKVKGLSLGAVDFITKPLDYAEVTARIKTHLDLYQLQTRLEQAVVQRTEALAREKALLRCVIDAIPDLIAFEDPQGAFLGCNKAFEAFIGYEAKHLLGQTGCCFLSPEEKDQFINLYDKQTRKKTKNNRVWKTRSNNRKVLLDTIKTTFGKSNQTPLGMVTISRDITEQEKAREEHQKLYRRLKQAQKLEAIGTLAGGIAHDFNNILSSVIGFTELAQEDAPAGSILEDNLNEVLQASMRAKELVSQILTFARQSDEEIKPVKVSLIAKEAAKLLRATLPANIEIQSDLENGSRILCDPTQLHQVFLNLCTNAAQAMDKDGGFLTVTLNDVQLTGDLANQHHLVPGSYLKLQISDTGPGITPDILDKIFEPYFTTKPQGEGTGLGLAVVHGIVSACNGTIEVNSKEGQGTAFTLYFPIADVDIPVTFAQTDDVRGGHEKILIVDDEAPIAKINSQVLQMHGYSVATCTNSITALELFRSDPYHFDLLLTDMTMPGLSGDELSKKVRALQPKIPIVICTGYTKSLSVNKAEKIGINAFLMKPLSQNTLLQTVRQVLDLQTDRK